MMHSGTLFLSHTTTIFPWITGISTSNPEKFRNIYFKLHKMLTVCVKNQMQTLWQFFYSDKFITAWNTADCTQTSVNEYFPHTAVMLINRRWTVHHRKVIKPHRKWRYCLITQAKYELHTPSKSMKSHYFLLDSALLDFHIFWNCLQPLIKDLNISDFKKREST